MAVILSGGSLVGTTGAPLVSYGGAPGAGLQPSLYDALLGDYSALYRTQPAVRTVADFLARNIAQLGLHVYARSSDDSRTRVRDHPVVALLGRPNPWTTRYRLIDALVHDMCLWDNAYWLRQVDPSGASHLVRLPPRRVRPIGGDLGGPAGYELTLPSGAAGVLEPGAVIHFRGYHPDADLVGLSPMATLAGILAESVSAADYRAGFWRNAARVEGLLTRPADAPEWTASARGRFKAEFEALYTGAGNSGRTAILEDGMTWTQTAFSAKESQYLEARKLTREEVAAAFHIPLPMVGILDHATFSNVREQHKQLYADTLGPHLRSIAEEIELQLLPAFTGTGAFYLDFNLEEKLRGSFEEQAETLRTSVGAPWLTRNEARARADLPRIDGGDDLVVPLNLSTDPAGSAPAAEPITA